VLEVFNVLGQSVARLVDEVASGGIHQAQFDGRALASGTYIYRLQSKARHPWSGNVGLEIAPQKFGQGKSCDVEMKPRSPVSTDRASYVYKGIREKGMPSGVVRALGDTPAPLCLIEFGVCSPSGHDPMSRIFSQPQLFSLFPLTRIRISVKLCE